MSLNTTQYIFGQFEEFKHQLSVKKTILIIDENVFNCYENDLKEFYKIIIPAGEQFKNIDTVKNIYDELVNLEADRTTFIVGVGGGVTTDIAGFVASTYMRGLKFGFVPTSLLSMVDASIGGKNGVDLGLYKNLVGTINQPDFIFYDPQFLKTLPQAEWINGCAEIIKHACIKDEKLFNILNQNDLKKFQTEDAFVLEIIKKNVTIKKSFIENDPFEKGERKILNFGHTIGHAIENYYKLSHGHAIAIGMVIATKLSTKLLHFPHDELDKLIKLLKQYHLPITYDYDAEMIFSILKMDKKRDTDFMNFILLKNIGSAKIEIIKLSNLQQFLIDLK